MYYLISLIDFRIPDSQNKNCHYNTLIQWVNVFWKSFGKRLETYLNVKTKTLSCLTQGIIPLIEILRFTLSSIGVVCFFSLVLFKVP